MCKLGLEKAEEPEMKLPTFVGSQKKQESSRKTTTSLLTTPKSLCGSRKLWKILQETRIPDNLTCFLRNLYAGQEATVRTLHRTTDRFKIEKGVRQGRLLSARLFNLSTEHVMRNAGLDELQAGIDSWEKHRQPQVCRGYHSNGRK